MFTTVYEQDSFEPVARLVWLKDELLKAANDEISKAPRERWEDEPTLIPNMQVYHYHNDHLGTPNELTSHQGEVVWLADYQAWGNTAQVVWREEKLEQLQVSKEHLQPLRFQGQYYDEETGLHYNRFRYFDPDLGMFISRDPIGLMGGSNVFAYAPNPTGWIDPLGLSKNSKGSQTSHTDCCKCAEGFAYRVIRDDEDLIAGINPKDPLANNMEEGHVLHGSKPKFTSQYTSVSRTLEQAIKNRAKFGKPNQRIVKIDLSKINGTVVDLNSPCSPLKGNMAKNWAKDSGEMLILGNIPPSAISVLSI